MRRNTRWEIEMILFWWGGGGGGGGGGVQCLGISGTLITHLSLTFEKPIYVIRIFHTI